VITFTVKLDPGFPGTQLTNTASVSLCCLGPSGGATVQNVVLINTQNDTASATTAVVRLADLAVAKTSLPV
jgi:hypothetical protein